MSNRNIKDKSISLQVLTTHKHTHRWFLYCVLHVRTEPLRNIINKVWFIRNYEEVYQSIALTQETRVHSGIKNWLLFPSLIHLYEFKFNLKLKEKLLTA
jgi:hypothetical protein